MMNSVEVIVKKPIFHASFYTDTEISEIFSEIFLVFLELLEGK